MWYQIGICAHQYQDILAILHYGQVWYQIGPSDHHYQNSLAINHIDPSDHLSLNNGVIQ